MFVPSFEVPLQKQKYYWRGTKTKENKTRNQITIVDSIAAGADWDLAKPPDRNDGRPYNMVVSAHGFVSTPESCSRICCWHNLQRCSWVVRHHWQQEHCRDPDCCARTCICWCSHIKEWESGYRNQRIMHTNDNTWLCIQYYMSKKCKDNTIYKELHTTYHFTHNIAC